jgi:hypothetical protein
MRFRAPTGLPGREIELATFHRIAQARSSLHRPFA